MRLPGAMLSFELAAGEPAARRLAEATRLFTLAESLGAVESLIELPAAMTHFSVVGTPLAVPPGLVRLSVGIEAVEDLHRRPRGRAGRRSGVTMSGDPPPTLPEDGPTRLVEGNDGELVERLSGGTATLLLVWLIGIGAGTALLGAWLLAAVILRIRLGAGELLGAPGLYIGAAGSERPDRAVAGRPCPGPFAALVRVHRAQDRPGDGRHPDRRHAARLFVMGVSFAAGALIVAAGLVGVDPGRGGASGRLATWSADRYIAGARVISEPDQTS